MTRQYEAVYVFDSTLEDAAITDKLGRFHDLLGTPGDLQLSHWGRRQLAYPIGRTASSQHPDAAAFAAYLGGPAATRQFEKYGFTVLHEKR